MKKLIAAALTLMLLLTGCGSSGSDALTVQVPDGFEATSTKGVDAYYICEDKSNINWVTAKKDKDFSSTTAQSLEEGVKSAISKQKKEDVSVTTNSFEFTTVAGLPAYRWDATYTLSSGNLRQLVVCMDGTHQYTVTYTDATADESWMDTFYESAGAITVKE